MRAPSSVAATFCALAVGVCGCQSSPPQVGGSPSPTLAPASPAPTPSLDAGWTLHVDGAEGYAIALPNTWNVVLRDAPTFDADVKTIATANADLGKYFQDGFSKGDSSGIKLIATEPRSVQSGFVTNLSVFKNDYGPVETAPDASAVAAAKLSLVGKNPAATDATQQRLKLPAGEAVRLSYSVKPGDRTAAVNAFFVALDTGGRRYIYEFIAGTTVTDPGTLFSHIADSFRAFATAVTSPARTSVSTPSAPG